MEEPFATSWFERELWSDRSRVVRLCTYITGDAQVADDLAQETLLEAWRHRDKLIEPRGFRPWISAIARNVCRRWGSRVARHPVFAAPSLGTVDQTSPIDMLADDFDIEELVERHELVQLLDRAMSLLPAETRAVLVQRFVDELPLREAAARLGLTEGAR